MPAMYNDTDKNPALGGNYYRLQVFPKDGAAFYTNVVHLQFNEQKQRITVYPNPADEYVMVHIEDATEKTATLRLYNVFGQQMKQMKFDELPNGDIRIALDNLVDGSYYLHLTIDGQHTIVEKLVVDKLNGYRPGLD